MASNVAPPAGGGGGAAAAVGSAALHAGQRGAAIAQKGVVNLTIYVQRRGFEPKKTGKKGGKLKFKISKIYQAGLDYWNPFKVVFDVGTR